MGVCPTHLHQPEFLADSVRIPKVGRLYLGINLPYLCEALAVVDWPGFVGTPASTVQKRVSACVVCSCSMYWSCWEAPAENSAASCAT